MIVCTGCGSVLEHEEDRVEQLRAELAREREERKNLAEQLELAEQDLRVKRAQVTRLKGERAGDRTADPHWEDAERVFTYWKSKLSPRAREFGEDRAAKVLARLHAGHPVEDLLKAVDGAAARPFVVDGRREATGAQGQRFVDLELICRSEKHLAKFMSYAEPDYESTTPVELVPSGELPHLLTKICDCSHSMAEHIPPKLLTEADRVFRLRVPPEFHPCAHGDCYCLDFTDLHQRAEEKLAEREAQERRRQMRNAA